MANQFLSLSLFLMLLSFFIVMNSMSNYEVSKAKTVLNSLSLAFSNEGAENRAPEEVETPRKALLQGDTLEELEGLFDGHIEGFEATRNRLGTQMHVQVPTYKFENAINIESLNANQIATGESGSFVKTMVSLMRTNNKGRTYTVDIVLNLPDAPATVQRDEAQDFDAALKRVSAMASKLEGAGLPQKMISAGLGKGKEGYVELYFTPYEKFEFPEAITFDSQASKGAPNE